MNKSSARRLEQGMNKSSARCLEQGMNKSSARRLVFLFEGWLILFPRLVIKHIAQRFLFLLGMEYCEFSIYYGPGYDTQYVMGEYE